MGQCMKYCETAGSGGAVAVGSERAPPATAPKLVPCQHSHATKPSHFQHHMRNYNSP